MRTCLAMISMLLGAALAAAQQPPARPKGSEEPAFQLPAGVEVERDLVYARYGARELKLDLYRPASGEGPFPGIVFIHGGGWRGGNRSAFRRQAAHLAAKGFVGAAIEYRLSGEAAYPAAVHDAKAAVRWMRANAAKYRINPDKIGAAGGSAGGHLVSLLGTTAAIRELEGEGGNSGFSSRVQAVAAFNPALDLITPERQPGNAQEAVRGFLGGPYEKMPGAYAQASPITHAGKASAPHLFLHGTADATVPYQQSVDMQKKLRAAGVRAELFTAEGAPHGFYNRPPHFQPTLERMEQFFQSVLGGKTPAATGQ